MAIETVRGDCTRQIIDRWTGRLSVVDVWAYTHCETVILGEMRYEDTYRLAYIRGPEGIVVALAEQLR